MEVSPRGVGVEHWPCHPSVSGSIPSAGNLMSCLPGSKFMDSQKKHKALVQMVKRLERTSGHSECGSASSTHSVPT